MRSKEFKSPDQKWIQPDVHGRPRFVSAPSGWKMVGTSRIEKTVGKARAAFYITRTGRLKVSMHYEDQLQYDAYPGSGTITDSLVGIETELARKVETKRFHRGIVQRLIREVLMSSAQEAIQQSHSREAGETPEELRRELAYLYGNAMDLAHEIDDVASRYKGVASEVTRVLNQISMGFDSTITAFERLIEQQQS